MRKHNEGYALPFVLVVITVLFLVALAISTVSLRNLQSQQASIQQMQDKYEAQGQIEIVTALIDNISSKTHISDLASLGNLDDDEDIEVEIIPQDPSNLSEDATSLEVTLVTSVGNTKITCTLLLHSTDVIPTGTGPIIYQLTNPSYEYISYNISTAGGGTDE